jgi:hypothetical protein
MNPAEAVKAHIDLDAKQSIGMHFRTFHMSAESIDQPLTDLKAALSQGDIPESRFITLHEGETRAFKIPHTAGSFRKTDETMPLAAINHQPEVDAAKTTRAG